MAACRHLCLERLLIGHRPPCLIFTLFYSLSLIGPFYPSSNLLLPSFYPKAYHYVIWETEGTGQRPAHQMRWITPLTLLTSVATRQSLNALSIVLAAPKVNCADFCRDSTITEQAQMVLAAPKVALYLSGAPVDRWSLRWWTTYKVFLSLVRFLMESDKYRLT